MVAGQTVNLLGNLGWFDSISSHHYAPLAQWNRASDYGSEGYGFESYKACLCTCGSVGRVADS